MLSGDLEQNDTTGPNWVVTDVANITGINAYHVLTGGWDPEGMLDGVTVTAGQANGTGYNVLGGGMVGIWDSSPTLTNVNFIGNQAEYGGGMYNFNGNGWLTNVTFSGNQAAVAGGGVYNEMCSWIILAHVTFTGNQAEYGGAMANYIAAPWLTNAIFWNNQADTSGHQIYNDTSTPEIKYSDIQGSGGSTSWDSALGNDGWDNIDADPLFVTPVDPATAPSTAGDLHLRNGSPAIDAGMNGYIPPTDLDGNLRPIDGDLDGTAVCDMGAYEKLIDLFLPLIMR